jgi:aromatic ring hydroxylase
MGQNDEDFALSFTLPVDTPGLTLIASRYLTNEVHPFEYPISSQHKMMETTSIFEDVFIPWEYVFLCGEWEFAGPLALQFVEYHRFTAVSYKLPLVDLFVGAGKLIAEMNGISNAGHVRDKLTWLVAYAETTRALLFTAAHRYKWDGEIAYPDPLFTNLAKLHFASNYHTAIHHLQDLAGGLLVTSPAIQDWDHQELGKKLERTLIGASGTGRERAAVLNLISDLVVAELGGYHAVLAVHAEGSIEAEKMMVYRSYDPERAVEYARRLARLDD